MIAIPRFISNAREYAVVCWRTIDRATSLELDQPQERGFIAQFRVDGSLSPWERDDAMKRLGHRGIGEGEDVSHRLSVYDTDIEARLRRWTPEFKERVEQALREAPGNGQRFIEVDMPRAPKPWPAYDKLKDPEQIATRVRDLGLSVELVIAYEEQNKNRPKVIEALQALGVEPEPESLVTA